MGCVLFRVSVSSRCFTVAPICSFTSVMVLSSLSVCVYRSGGGIDFINFSSTCVVCLFLYVVWYGLGRALGFLITRFVVSELCPCEVAMRFSP